MNILITAGPTREYIDPTRFISSPSTGKMGYALAQAASKEHHVTLISGPTAIDVPSYVDFISVETAQEMYQATEQVINRHNIFIACAAVSDYCPAQPLTQKKKKNSAPWQMQLIRTPDILGSVRNIFQFDGYTVGFAAETQNVADYAQKKKQQKQCDMIISNHIGKGGIGFQADTNEVNVYTDKEHLFLPKTDKQKIACQILALIMKDYNRKYPTT